VDAGWMDRLVLVIVAPSFVVVIKIVVVFSRVDAGKVETCVEVIIVGSVVVFSRVDAGKVVVCVLVLSTVVCWVVICVVVFSTVVGCMEIAVVVFAAKSAALRKLIWLDILESVETVE
jgi:hypothetical protein